MCYASVLTSSSYPVRKVLIDPSLGDNGSRGRASNNKKKRNNSSRWLHTSIYLRTKAIQTFQCVTTSFGSDATGNVSSNLNKRSKAAAGASSKTEASEGSYDNSNVVKQLMDGGCNHNCSDGERTILLVVGSLIEQLNWKGREGIVNLTDTNSGYDDRDDWGSLSERVDLV